jgi:hypothetical protein
VVGYSADVFFKAQDAKTKEPSFSLSDRDESELLALARKSVEHAVQDRHALEPGASASDALNQ